MSDLPTQPSTTAPPPPPEGPGRSTEKVQIESVEHHHETMSRDEQIRWCALQIAHASTPDRFVKVVNGPVTTIARAQYLEAYLRGEELPEWIDRDEVAVPTDVTGP